MEYLRWNVLGPLFGGSDPIGSVVAVLFVVFIQGGSVVWGAVTSLGLIKVSRTNKNSFTLMTAIFIAAITAPMLLIHVSFAAIAVSDYLSGSRAVPLDLQDVMLRVVPAVLMLALTVFACVLIRRLPTSKKLSRALYISAALYLTSAVLFTSAFVGPA